MSSAIRLMLLWMAVGVSAAYGATLALGQDDTAAEPETILVPVTLVPGAEEAVAGFQFDVAFDSAALEFRAAESGPSAASAEKTAHANLLRPGQLRVVVAGFNRNTIGEGTVLLLRFGSGSGGRVASQVRLENAVLSDPFGSPVPVAVSPDTLILGGETAESITTTTGGSAPPEAGLGLLYRYRAILFALVVVGFTMLLVKTAPKKRLKR